VLAGTLAERAGLRPGDVVVAVNGIRVLERGCDRWKEEHRTKTEWTVLRDGETFDRLVEIVDIVP
jgi:C-terminal processing protease CtpA/Prc